MLKIYFKLKEQYIKTEMEYSFNFWMMVFAGVLMRFLMLGVPFVIYQNVTDIAGWQEWEVYLIMAFLFISDGTCSLLFDGVWHIPAKVFNGQFDLILSRPVSPLFQIIATEIGLQGFGNLAIGVVSITASLSALGMLHPLIIAQCLFFVCCGTVIRTSVNLISNSLVFWFEAGGTNNIPFMVNTVGEYAKYPITIYPGWMQVILGGIIPFAFIGFVPALILKGYQPVLLYVLLFGVAAVFLLLARTVFYRGIQHYESMGM